MKNINDFFTGSTTNVYSLDGNTQRLPVADNTKNFFFHRALSFGDYDYSCEVERSNVRVFLSEHSEHVDVVHITGAYNFQAVGIRVTTEDEELIKILSALESYPVLDDSDVSLMEMELEEEWLSCFGLSDFRDAVVKKFDADECELPDSELTDLYYSLKERSNEYGHVEAGGNWYIDVDKLVSTLEDDKSLKLVTYS